tara:strand:+ start:8458 stop:8775 length:318 start_codon:yes stop_codon:yes gene_type:complete
MIKLKDTLNEASQQWQVKDIIVMQKAHERVLKATASLQKAVERLGAVSNKNRNKPNGGMFVTEAESMRKSFLKAVMPGSKFWKTWEEYKKGGEAAFPKNWKTTRK